MRLPFRLRPWMVVSALWVAPATLAIVATVAERRLHGEPSASRRDLVWAAGDWLVYAFLTPVIIWCANRWPVVRPHLGRRVVLHLLIALVFCVAWAAGGTSLEIVLGLIFDPAKAHELMAVPDFWSKLTVHAVSWILTTLPFGVVVYLTVVGLAHSIRYFVEARDRELQLARISEQLTNARFSALQAQLNPHFLFNTLNTIAVRARDGDGAGTARMVEQLSEVLRRTLSRHQANEVTLEEELELVREYLAIEEARFPDRLRPIFDVGAGLGSAAVPSFAVQHLVENAIRHGITRRSDAGRLEILARHEGDMLVVTVTDDGAGVDLEAASRSGHGLENTRERLRALYGTRPSLVVAPAAGVGTVATLTVPYRELVLDEEPDGR